MRTLALVLPLAWACSPTIADVGSETNDSGLFVGGDDGADGNGGGSGGGGADGTGGTEPAVALASGTWVATDAGYAADPCGWEEVVLETTGLSILDLLPSQFEVNGAEGSFTIRALDYGADGAIDCTFEGEAFSCEEQGVSPEAYDLGDYGWRYAIVFSGEAVGDQQLRGTAVVDYPSVDSQTARAFDYYGVDATECTQSFDLELTFEG